MAFEELTETLKKNGFQVSVFETKQEASDYLDQQLDGITIGCGGSMTLKEMEILPRLAQHNTIYSHSAGSADAEKIMKQAMNADVYLMSANAISKQDGAILNIDGTGNRVSSSLYGHKKVYMVAGKNKISSDFHSALMRLKNVVAPKNAMRLQRNTPCAVKGDRCYDCDCEERICNALVVHYKKIKSMDMEIVLINEELGY